MKYIICKNNRFGFFIPYLLYMTPVLLLKYFKLPAGKWL